MRKTKLAAALDMPDGVMLFGDPDYRGECPAEDSDLISFVAWLKYNWPELESCIIHTPNEGGLPVQARMQQKKKGVLFRCPDIIVMTVPAFCMELKRRNPAKSLARAEDRKRFSEQVDVLASMQKQGNFSCAALGIDAAREAWKYFLAWRDGVCNSLVVDK